MESTILENLKENLMKDKILDTLRPKLDASYKEYMDNDYPKRLAGFKTNTIFYQQIKPEPPKPRPSTDFFIKKMELYVNKIPLSEADEFITQVEGYKENCIITIYILTSDGRLLKIKSFNGESPTRVDYIINKDISKAELESDRIIYLYTYNHKWQSSEALRFDNEDTAHHFYSRLNGYRNHRPGSKNKGGQ